MTNNLKTSIITKQIVLNPSCLKSSIRKDVLQEIKKKYEKLCCDDYGLILSIDEMLHLDNMINKDSITITFNVTFKALTLKPEKDMIFSFVPNFIMQKGIFGKLHEIINFFIPDTMLTDMGYQFDSTKNCFSKKETVITKIIEIIKKKKVEREVETENTKIIDKDTTIVVKIEQLKYDSIKYNCITSLIDVLPLSNKIV